MAGRSITAVKKNEVETKPEVKKETKKETQRVYKSTDLIPCRSITQGTLLMSGAQSKILYTWVSYGDIVEVEYRDLYSLKASHSGYIYEPFFVIEDKELLKDARWKDLNDLYDKLYDSSDINTVIDLPITKFKEVLKTIPEGFKNAIKIEIATRLNDGTFDSISKVRAVDEICGTELEKQL